jgi:hypothetical protein
MTDEEVQIEQLLIEEMKKNFFKSKQNYFTPSGVFITGQPNTPFPSVSLVTLIKNIPSSDLKQIVIFFSF